jgi:hypothetical protein
VDVLLLGQVNLGFNYVYDKTVLDDLEVRCRSCRRAPMFAFAQFVTHCVLVLRLQGNNLDTLRAYISGQGTQLFKGAHFTENHDEPRAAAALGGDQQAFAGTVVATTLPGLRLFYFGQFQVPSLTVLPPSLPPSLPSPYRHHIVRSYVAWVAWFHLRAASRRSQWHCAPLVALRGLQGFKNRLDVHLRRAVSEAGNATVEALYGKLTTLLSVGSGSVFHEGTWTYIPIDKSGTGWRLCAWRWSSGGAPGSKRLVVVNFSDTQGWGNVVVSDAEVRAVNALCDGAAPMRRVVSRWLWVRRRPRETASRSPN